MRSLNKKYDEVHAVIDVNLDINDQEFVVLVGPSGCGKTTTLRMVAGLESITAGNISIDEKVVNELPPMDRDIAMVFQNYALYPHMTVYDNMAFGLKMRKFDKPEIAKRVKEAADILGIQELLKRKPRQLSGGQRQRVALGRAIVRHPQVFLFDEPLSNLDAKLRVQMRVELKKLHERLGTTAIYVTHDQVEAMTLGDRVVVMRDGRVQQVGDPMELYNQPANRFVAGFIGSPAMNFAQVRIAAENGSLWAESEGLRIKVPAPLVPRLGALRRQGSRRLACGPRTCASPRADPTGSQLRRRGRGGRAARLGDPARRRGRRRRRWSPRSSRRSPPRCTKSCASRSTRTGCISSTIRPKPRSSSPASSRYGRKSAGNRRQSKSGSTARPQGRKTMTQIRRRQALAIVRRRRRSTASTGGLAGILASGRAPAYAQTQTVHWLRWADFVPASDAFSRGNHQTMRKRPRA